MRKLIYTVTSVILIIGIMLVASGCVLSVSDEHYTQASSSLINPDASPEAVKLMSFLKSQYGDRIISGQYINEYEDFSLPQFRVDPESSQSPMTVFKANELQAVYKVTGDYPVVAGFDVSILLDQESYSVENRSVEQAIEWHNAGGIVTFCWHWLVDNFDGNKRAFYTEQTNFDLQKALADKTSEQYRGLIADIDKVSEYMTELKTNKVPVLWRPLHEAAGGWFWWGASGADAYKELWDIVYERMTVYHKLDNLIWVTNPQDAKWYVGDDPYYDYSLRKNYEKDRANAKRFKKNYRFAGNKMIAMTENDFIPDIDAVFDKNVKWLFFATWCREFVCEYAPDNDGNRFTRPIYSEMCTTREELKKIYDDDRVWTLNKLNKSGLYRNTSK